MISTIATFLLGGMRRILRWATSHPWQAALIIAVALLWLQNGRLNSVRRDVVSMTALRDAERAAHRQTVTNYLEAAKRAEMAQKANLARVKNEQEQISNERVEALEERLAVGQSRYDRLRAQSEAHSRRTAEAGMSAASESSCKAHAGTACENLPALLKAAQDNTDTLIELQKWVKDQASVATSP